MDDQKLDRYLKSVGMKCFVTYFEDFSNDELSNNEIAEKVFAENNYTHKACVSRTGHSRMIIRGGRAKDAIILVTKAAKIDNGTTQKAKALLASHFSTRE